MKNTFLIFILISLIFISGCRKMAEPINTNDNLLTNEKVNEQTKCESAGGVWKKYVEPSGELLDKPFCTLPFSDYGKKCTDSSQCIGNCEPPDEFLSRENGKWVVLYRENISGTCSKFNKDCESYQITNGTLNLESQVICIV
jgi:hypothetical protein